MNSTLQKFINSSTTRNSYYDSGFDIYDEIQGASIPLVYKEGTPADIRQISLLEEVELALYGSNKTAEVYPNSSQVVTGTQFRSVGFLLPNNHTIEDITHGHDPDSGITYWFAIVNTPRGESEIWRSVDKITWTRCPIDTTAYYPVPFVLKYIDTEAEAHTDDFRNHFAPVIVAVGSEGLLIRSEDFLNFETVPITNIANSSSADFVEITHDLDDGNWMVVNSSGSPFQVAINSTRDIQPDQWVAVSNATTNPPVSITWGNTSPTNDRYVVLAEGEIAYSDDDGSSWTSVYFNGIQFTSGRWSPDAGLFVAVGSDANGYGAIFTSPDGASWSRKNMTNASGALLTGVDYGNGRWVISSEKRNVFWYSNEANPQNFFYSLIDNLSSNFYGSSVQYGGGDTKSWLMTSSQSNEIIVSDNISEYHGALTDQFFGHATVGIGTFHDTYYDSIGIYQSDSSSLYQFYDSDISYDYYFGQDQSIYIGADLEGNLREMPELPAIFLGTRLASYKFTFNMPSTFMLERDDILASSPDANEWEPWVSPVFTNTVSDTVEYQYTIWRRKYDPTVIPFEDNLELDAFSDTDYVFTGYVEPDYFMNSYFNGIRPFINNRGSQVCRNIQYLGEKETGVGDYLLLDSGTNPHDIGRDGSWKTSGSALNTYDDGTGNIVQENKYYLWVKSAPPLNQNLNLKVKSGSSEIIGTV